LITKLSQLLTKVNIVIEKIEEIILCLGITILAVILIVNVIARKSGTSIYFVDELAMLLVIWITFIGLSYAARKGRHIRMAAIFDLSTSKIQKFMMYVISAISAIFMFYMTYLSYNYVYTTFRWQQMLPALGIPYWIGVFIVPLGFFLAGIHYLMTIVQNIRMRDEVWISPEQKSEYE
jgi:C4-dicarboxylate transporter, DctQ subunit